MGKREMIRILYHWFRQRLTAIFLCQGLSVRQKQYQNFSYNEEQQLGPGQALARKNLTLYETSEKIHTFYEKACDVFSVSLFRCVPF